MQKRVIIIYMCGFAGIVNNKFPFEEEQLKAIASKVAFRGPDSTGIRISQIGDQTTGCRNAALFFNRLSILDIDARSDQPFEDQNNILLFNGEIYNYREIKAELQSLGFTFSTNSDTEVLFYALQKWGKRAIPRLNGMFAFFYLNKHNKNFILSRDRLGIKPLYYSQQNGQFSFGSELRSVLTLLNITPSISQDAVEMFLWLQYIPTPYTIVKGVNKLPPGHYIEGNVDDLEKLSLLTSLPYWDAFERPIEKYPEDSESLEEILRQSLERQLHADVPLGLFLSSGVDSSLLASLIHKYFSDTKSFNFFTIAFEEDTLNDESGQASAFIKKFNNPNLHNHTLSINSSYIQNKLERLYDFYDEPFADPAALLNWAISEKAREHVKVAISGDGADELFWGYPRYNQWQRFMNIASTSLMKNVVQRIAQGLSDSNLKYKALFVSEADPIACHFNLLLPSGFRFLITDPILDKFPMWATKNLDQIRNRKDLPAMLDLKMYLTDAMLFKVDRSSMASSLEVRVPYLDNEVLDYALQLPFSKKSNSRFNNKAILKDILTKLAPHYDTQKRKRGFNFPLHNWMKRHWRDQILSTTTKDALIDLGLDPQPYLEMIDSFFYKQSPNYNEIWHLFNLALWNKSLKEKMTSSI